MDTMRNFFCCLIVLGCGYSSFVSIAVAQVDPFANYMDEYGVPPSLVNKIFQDRDGYLWFATQDGVSKFDGYHCKNFVLSEEGQFEFVQIIYEDTHGRLWFGTVRGLFKYEDEKFARYTTEHGLCDNWITALQEDDAGTLWIGTRAGLCSFDGSAFSTILNKQAFPKRSIHCLLMDSRKRLWIGATGYLTCYDGENVVDYSDSLQLSANAHSSVYEDASGNIWGVTEERLSKITDRQIQQYDTPVLIQFKAQYMAEDRNGHFWFATDHGALQFDGERFCVYTKDDGLASNSLLSVLVDHAGNIWFGTRFSGIAKFDGHHFTAYDAKYGLGSYLVMAMFIDSEGNLWVANSNFGVSRFLGDAFTTFTIENGLVSELVYSLFEDMKGRYWIGTSKGLNSYDGRTFTAHTIAAGLHDVPIRSIYEDSHGNLWVGSQGGGVSVFRGSAWTNYTTHDGLSDNWVYDILEDANDNLWFATFGHGVSRLSGASWTTFDTGNGLASNFVWDIARDTDGNLWFATSKGGISAYTNGQWVTYTTADGLAHNDVRCILADTDCLWFGTYDGLSRFDGARFTNYKIDSSLPDHVYGAILRDREFLYIGTSSGLYRYNPENGDFRQYTKRDGLAATAIRQNAILKDRAGNLWFGTYGGVSRFVPQKDFHIHSPPPVHITHLMAAGHPAPVQTPLELSWFENSVSFQFIGLSFRAPDRIQYLYRLAGLAEQWNSTSQRRIDFPYLPPGQYTFQVKAQTDDNVQSRTPAEVSFIIQPPLWQRTWLRGMMIGIVALGLVGGHRIRTRMYKRRNREMEKAVTARTIELEDHKKYLLNAKAILEQARDELEGIVQLRTRELQDTVNRLKMLASQLTLTEERQRRQIAVGLHDLIGQHLTFIHQHIQRLHNSNTAHAANFPSERLLALLDQVITDIRSLTLELSPPELYYFGLEPALERHIELIQAHSDITFSFHDDGQPKPLSEDLRLLLFSAARELLVNVIKHSRAQCSDIAIWKEDHRIYVRVSDDGIGFNETPQSTMIDKTGGFGLFSIRERLYSVGGRLTIQSVEKAGSRITIDAPLEDGDERTEGTVL